MNKVKLTFVFCDWLVTLIGGKYPYNWYTVQEITIASVGDEENSLLKKWFNDRLKEYPFLKKQNINIQE